MATLRELTEEWLALYEMADAGEFPEDVLKDTLEGLEGELEIKADGYADVIFQIRADVAMLKAERDRIDGRIKALTGNEGRLMEGLQGAMVTTGKTKFKTLLHSFGIQKNPASVVLTSEDIPKEWLIAQEPKIDKAGIKKALQEGETFEFAHLEQTESLRIR